MGLRARWSAPLVAAACVALVAGAVRGKGTDEVRAALERELDLTRGRSAVSAGLRALEREHSSLEYAAVVLEHGSSESLRRLDAYRVSRDTRERQVRRRTRALYKLARGGMLRLMFEGIDDTDARRTEQARRITRGRTMRWLVKHDMRELGVHRRAEARARTELLAAARELQSLSGLHMAAALQEAALRQAASVLDPELAKAHAERRRLVRRHGRGSRGTRELLTLVRRERRAMHDGGPGLGDVLRSPTGRKIVGRFGDYRDPVLRLPMRRNGIELAASRAQRVRALASGKVVFVGELPGFDEVVVVDHGDGYTSLTARLMDVTVADGADVEPGDVIGRVAPKTVDDGLGRTVYLELRHGDRPLDPTPYVRGS